MNEFSFNKALADTLEDLGASGIVDFISFKEEVSTVSTPQEAQISKKQERSSSPVSSSCNSNSPSTSNLPNPPTASNLTNTIHSTNSTRVRTETRTMARSTKTAIPVVVLSPMRKETLVETTKEDLSWSEHSGKSSLTMLSEIDYNRSPELVLSDLANVVSQCTLCQELSASRTQTVFGTGNPRAELVFLGEGPGADEDRQGLPFVGRSGQLLTDIITKGMKLKREDVYICNIVRCRPPANRTPSQTEAEYCRPFLEATLKVIAPKYICCLGATAATNLLQTDTTIGKLRGKVHLWNKTTKVICTYHPAYLLRNPPAKAQTWEDIKLLMHEMGLPVSNS